MQTILGSSGQIGSELARSLKHEFTSDIRLVSRRPEKVNEADQLFAADLLQADQTRRAVAGSEVVYFTAGLPIDTKLWVAQWPVMMGNVIDACAAEGARLVFFDNTYMYPQNSAPLTEEAAFKPYGAKGRSRAEIARQLLDAMQSQKVEAVICRAPEFYGPGKTQSITNRAIIEPLLAGKKAKVFLRDDTRRSLIYTPDASRAMAWIGNTRDAYGQTWHLPCDDARMTYAEFIQLAASLFGTEGRYVVLKRWQLAIVSRFNATVRETQELLPRYEADNLFVSDKFKKRFPEFEVTTFRRGLEAIRDESGRHAR